MGKVLVEVGWSDLIECPQRISENIQRYADEFIKSRKCKINILRSVDKNGHSGKRTVSMGCSYETSDFVEWLNIKHISEGEEKVCIIAEDI